MVDPVATPPAGTPPANDPNGGQPQPTPAPAPQPGNNPAPQGGEFIVNQEQFNKRWAEKMTALESEIGMPIKDLKPFIEKNKPKPAASGETLTGADLKIAKMEALMTAGVPAKQIPLLLQHLNISGKTREEIDASIQSLIAVKLLTIEVPAVPGIQQPPTAAQGAGNPGVPVAIPAKRWTASEINAMTHEQIIANEAEIDKVQKEGRIDYHL